MYKGSQARLESSYLQRKRHSVFGFRNRAPIQCCNKRRHALKAAASGLAQREAAKRRVGVLIQEMVRPSAAASSKHAQIRDYAFPPVLVLPKTLPHFMRRDAVKSAKSQTLAKRPVTLISESSEPANPEDLLLQFLELRPSIFRQDVIDSVLLSPRRRTFQLQRKSPGVC